MIFHFDLIVLLHLQSLFPLRQFTYDKKKAYTFQAYHLIFFFGSSYSYSSPGDISVRSV